MKKNSLDSIIIKKTLESFRQIMGESEGEKKKQKDLANLLRDADDLENVKVKPSKSKKEKEGINVSNSKADLTNITLNKIIDKLNMMRSGHSTKDENVQKNLDVYFKSLSMGERQSLFVFLDALNQILTGGVHGDAAPEPHLKGIETKATTSNMQNSKQTKSTDSIIIVGEAQDTNEIRKKLKELLK
jgi:hypothetical protein